MAVGYKSMNQQLNNAFLILAYERSRQMASSSATGMSDLFFRLKQVKEKLVGPSKSNPCVFDLALFVLPSAGLPPCLFIYSFLADSCGVLLFIFCRQRLYMVKVDIKKSFDSINQENLLEIIDRTLKEVTHTLFLLIAVIHLHMSRMDVYNSCDQSMSPLCSIGKVHHISPLKGDACKREDDEKVLAQSYRT